MYVVWMSIPDPYRYKAWILRVRYKLIAIISLPAFLFIHSNLEISVLFLALYCTVLFLALHCVCSTSLFPTVLPLPSITVETWIFVTSKKTETVKLIGLPLLQTPVLAPISASVISDQILVTVSGKFSQRTSVLCFLIFLYISRIVHCFSSHTDSSRKQAADPSLSRFLWRGFKLSPLFLPVKILQCA